MVRARIIASCPYPLCPISRMGLRGFRKSYLQHTRIFICL
nr:MAG TPA: hypothetical protein [Caudoviricetes sp.]